jgi:peptide/nickel transport system permease protein
MKGSLWGWILAGVALVLALMGLYPWRDPDAIELTKILAQPEWSAWLGYDELGRPIFERLIDGAQVAFFVAFWVVSLSAIVGISIGMVAGWYGGWVDEVLMRIVDVFLAFPGLLLALVLAGVLGPGLNNLVIALVVVGWVGYARLTRAQVLSLKERDHVMAARAIGLPVTLIWWRHILPLMMAPLLVEMVFGVAGAILAEAGLSFLGLGIQPPAASWGQMIREGARYMLTAPHLLIFSGLSLVFTVVLINTLGDRLRDRWDIKR